MDFASLVLFVTPISDRIGLTSVRFHLLTDVALGLLKFSDLSDLVFGVEANGLQIFSAAVGLIFYSALISSLFKIKEFSRTDADLIWLASHNLKLGKFSSALSYLNVVRSASEESKMLKVAALLGVNAVSDAIAIAEGLQTVKSLSATTDMVMSSVVDLCLMFPVPEHVILDVFQLCVKKEMPDVLLMDYVGVWGQHSNVTELDIKSLSTSVGGQYPLTQAQLELLVGELQKGTDILLGAEPARPIGKIVRSLMLLRARLLDPETDNEADRKACLDWIKNDLQVVENLLSEVIEPFEIAIGFGQLGFLQIALASLVPERLQEITYRRNLLKENCLKDPLATLIIKACELREVPIWRDLNRNS